jgi:hypothetical protein
MPYYDQSPDKDVGKTASNMVELANNTGEPVLVFWGDDEIIVDPGESVEEVQVRLETSTDRQQEDAGL